MPVAGHRPGGPAAGATGAPRAEVAHELAVTLAELGRRAGNGAPAGRRPPEVQAYAIADQLRVLGRETAETRPTAAAHAEAGQRRPSERLLARRW